MKAICYRVFVTTVLVSPEEGAMLLWKLASYIGMKGIRDVRVEFGPAFGYSAVLVIAESHLAIHTWTETGNLRVIVDSCKQFSVKRVKEFLDRELCPKHIFITGTSRNRPSWLNRILFWIQRTVSGRRIDDAGRERESGP